MYTSQPLLPRIAGQPAIHWLRDAVERFGDRVAIDDGALSLTYRQVWDAACRMATPIARSAPADRPVAVLLPNTAYYPIAWIACLMQGRVAAFLDTGYPEDRNRQCLDVTRPGAIIGQRNDAVARSVASGLLFLPIEDASAYTPPTTPAAGIAEEPAFIIFTSGSTGRPKGIAIGARAALNRAATLIDSLGTSPDDAILSMIPPSALGGMLNLFEAFLAGAALLKLDLVRQPLSLLAGKRITMLFATPALLRVVAQLDIDGRIRQGLRCVQPIGDAILQADLRMLRQLVPPGCAILNAYGSTEALVSLQWLVPGQYDRPGAKVATGYPVTGYTCTITGADGTPVPDGEPGELVLCSRHMSLGEWRDGRLITGPFEPDPDCSGRFVHHTGDIAVRHPDGVFAVLGRKDRQIKIRGNRIELAEIEEALRGLAGVAQAVVAARQGAVEGGVEPELQAFLVPVAPDTAATRRGIIGAARRILPTFMVPARFVFVAQLPLLPGGKIDVQALLDLPEAGAEPAP
jgi:acyl-coenzyme A synthetase/AMP-(fatty) acid ligase